MAEERTTSRRLEFFLRGVELFNDLDDEELRRLAGGFRESHHAKDDVVFRHGEIAVALYIVRSGAVALFRDQVGKPLQLLGRYSKGEFFGELGLFDGTRRQATARVSEPGSLLEIPRRQLLEFLSDRPNLALKLHTAAARRHTENVAAVLGIGPRDEVRIRVDRQVLMRIADGRTRHVVLENLSKGGLSLRGAPALWQPQTKVRFALELDDGTFDVHARVAWRSGDTVGLAFEARSPAQDERIQQALRRIFQPDPAALLAKATTPEEV